MKNLKLSINPSQLNRDGIRLRRLATLGQFLLLLGMLVSPFLLFAIAMPSPMESIGQFPNFIAKTYLHGPTAVPNLYALIKSCMILLALDQTRRLGRTLSARVPLGSDTLGPLRWLSYTLVILMFMLCFNVEIVPAADMQPANFETQWTVSSSPLYVGAMVWLGLSIVRGIVRQSVELKAESDAFI